LGIKGLELHLDANEAEKVSKGLCKVRVLCNAAKEGCMAAVISIALTSSSPRHYHQEQGPKAVTHNQLLDCNALQGRVAEAADARLFGKGPDSATFALPRKETGISNSYARSY
jgi:hypothetical protein